MKKILFQIFLSIILIIFCLFLYNKLNPSNKNLKKKIDDQNVLIQKNLINETIISPSYSSQDRYGNIYKIQSASGNYTDNQLMSLSDVKSKIILTNKDQITIFSDLADYNNENFDTIFNGHVKIIYGDHVIFSDTINFKYTENLIEIYDNVLYKNLDRELIADLIIINLINKTIKINMYNKNSKVLVKN